VSDYASICPSSVLESTNGSGTPRRNAYCCVSSWRDLRCQLIKFASVIERCPLVSVAHGSVVLGANEWVTHIFLVSAPSVDLSCLGFWVEFGDINRTKIAFFPKLGPASNFKSSGNFRRTAHVLVVCKALQWASFSVFGSSHLPMIFCFPAPCCYWSFPWKLNNLFKFIKLAFIVQRWPEWLPGALVLFVFETSPDVHGACLLIAEGSDFIFKVATGVTIHLPYFKDSPEITSVVESLPSSILVSRCVGGSPMALTDVVNDTLVSIVSNWHKFVYVKISGRGGREKEGIHNVGSQRQMCDAHMF